MRDNAMYNMENPRESGLAGDDRKNSKVRVKSEIKKKKWN